MRAAMRAVPRECAGSPLRPTAEGGLELDVIFEPHRCAESSSRGVATGLVVENYVIGLPGVNDGWRV